MTIVERVSLERSGRICARTVVAWAFTVPPLALLAIAAGLGFGGGGVTPEEWQPVAAGLTASLFVLAAVGAVPSLPKAAAPAVSALVALVAWAGASLVWTASRDATAENIVRLAMLAAAMVVGAAYAARPGSALALACGLASLGGLVAGVVELKLLVGSTGIFSSSRLSWPIQYANADAALVWLTLPAILALATVRRIGAVGDGLCALAGGLCVSVGFLTQSRGGAFGLIAALAVAFAIARDRARFALTTLAVIAPALLVVLVSGDPSDSSGAARARGLAIVAAAGGSAAFVGMLSALDRRMGMREARIAIFAWGLTLAVAGGVALAATSVRPTAHFDSDASNRNEYWRVVWDAFEARPLLGVGSGAFSVPWFRHRSVDENVTDAHSWEASALAETGIVGLLLTGAALLLPSASGRGTRRRGEDSWPLAAIALSGAGAYFVVHASLDWLFRVPAVAIPGFVVLGALASGGGTDHIMLPGLRQRVVLAAVALAGAAVTVPAYLSTANTARAEEQAPTSTSVALRELDLAARLNPFAARPLEVRASVLGAAGRPEAALAAAKQAVERDSNDWTAWLTLRQAEEAAGHGRAARVAYRRAHALNPRAALLELPD
jgi:O-Antigen ligase